MSRMEASEPRISPRTLVLVAVLLVGVLVFAWMRFMSTGEDKPLNPTGSYYSGPMRAKTGLGYGTEDGKAVPAPDGAAPIRQAPGEAGPRTE